MEKSSVITLEEGLLEELRKDSADILLTCQLFYLVRCVERSNFFLDALIDRIETENPELPRYSELLLRLVADIDSVPVLKRAQDAVSKYILESSLAILSHRHLLWIECSLRIASRLEDLGDGFRSVLPALDWLASNQDQKERMLMISKENRLGSLLTLLAQ